MLKAPVTRKKIQELTKNFLEADRQVFNEDDLTFELSRCISEVRKGNLNTAFMPLLKDL